MFLGDRLGFRRLVLGRLLRPLSDHRQRDIGHNSHCGMNAVLYLATNRLIREGVKNVFIKAKDEGSNQNGLANNRLTREGFINMFTKTKDEARF